MKYFESHWNWSKQQIKLVLCYEIISDKWKASSLNTCSFMPIFENLEQFTTTNDNNNDMCDINQYGQKGVEYNLQQFSIEREVEFQNQSSYSNWEDPSRNSWAAGSTSNDQNGAQQCSKVLKWSEAPKTRMVQCWGQLIAIQCNCIPFKVQLSITVKC